MTLDELYEQVTEAILSAERQPEQSAGQAWLLVSELEERIADSLPASDWEGAIGRRGAIRAAMKAQDQERVDMLWKKYPEVVL